MSAVITSITSISGSRSRYHTEGFYKCEVSLFRQLVIEDRAIDDRSGSGA